VVVGCKYFLPVPEYQFFAVEARYFFSRSRAGWRKAIPDVDRIRYLFFLGFENFSE
jgi:hypothetical protein